MYASLCLLQQYWPIHEKIWSVDDWTKDGEPILLTWAFPGWAGLWLGAHTILKGEVVEARLASDTTLKPHSEPLASHHSQGTAIKPLQWGAHHKLPDFCSEPMTESPPTSPCLGSRTLHSRTLCCEHKSGGLPTPTCPVPGITLMVWATSTQHIIHHRSQDHDVSAHQRHPVLY